MSYRYHVGVLIGICIGPKNLGVPRRLNWDRIVIVWHYVIVKFTTYTSAHETCSCWVKKINHIGLFGIGIPDPVLYQERTQEGADGAEAPRNMPNILGVFSCLV